MPTVRDRGRLSVLGNFHVRKADPKLIHAFSVAGRRFRWTPPILVILGLIAGLTEGLSIGLLIPLFSVIFGEGSGSETINEFVAWLGGGLSEAELVGALASSILFMAVLRAAVLWGYDTMSVWISGQVIHALRTAIFRQLLDVGYAFYLDRDRGRLLDILRGETWRVGVFLLGLARILISLCSIVALGVFLVMVSPQMTLGAAAGAAVIALLVRLMVLRASRQGQNVVDRSAALSRHISDALGSMRTIRLFGQERREQERFAQASERFRTAVQRLESTEAAIIPATELLYTPLFLAVLLVAWAMETSFPTVIGFMALLYRLQPHARRLDHLRVEVAGHLPAVRQIADLLDPADKLYVRSGQKPFSGFRSAVEFVGVGFSFEGESGDRGPAVTDLTFTIRRNQVTAIVGESGAGKSTAVNLLFRLYDPTIGEIRVDGTPLEELRLAEWRRHLAFAGQDADLIGDTIFEAIRFPRPDANRAAVERVAKQANADEFIQKLPQGYETPIGPEGLRLSVGQRQRLALARALVCDPEILVLDEATSALDPLTERLIHESLERLRGTLTIIVVAHRLSSIREADHVIVLREGCVAEQGSPDELLRNGSGAFAELWHAQSARSSRESA